MSKLKNSTPEVPTKKKRFRSLGSESESESESNVTTTTTATTTTTTSTTTTSKEEAPLRSLPPGSAQGPEPVGLVRVCYFPNLGCLKHHLFVEFLLLFALFTTGK
ncbi:unnamed protein product [Polarella glacialis]|uniref:Uncharacterized protein n=1 Tax=Polarella glacialis TaxID=89957 RepID=A0A813LK86_POLGL|nr:unnamed protein product [Polarella glacialis]